MSATISLQDNWNNNSISSNWEKTTLSSNIGEVNVIGGELRVDHTANTEYNGLLSVNTYDLTGSNFFVQITNYGNQAIVSHEVQLILYADANDKMWFTCSNGQLAGYKYLSGVQTNMFSMALDTHYHRWLRFRESGGITFMDTSPNSADWTSQFNITNQFAITSVKMGLISGCWQNEASASFGTFDNFNWPISQRFRNSGLRPRMFAPGIAR